MQEELANKFVEFIYQIVALDVRIISLVILTVFSVIVIDRLLSRIKESGHQTGITLGSPNVKAVKLEGSKTNPTTDYVSDIQGLAGRPDAVILEDGYFIPVEHKPLAKKIRDRYVAQLLVYMRLIEEFEGKRPPYGYLILGKNSRKVKIVNSEDRQRWLQRILDEMRGILEDGNDAKPTPHPRKCRHCRVRTSCDVRADVDVTDIGQANS